MSFPVSVSTVVEVIGVLTSIFIILAPIHKFWKIFKKKHVEENISGLPYLAIFINCTMWVLYRLPQVSPDCHCTMIFIINVVGIFFGLLYLAIVLVISRRNRVTTLVLFMVVLVFTIVFYVLILIAVHTPEIRSLIVGIMCVVSGVMVYASTIPALVEAWMNKNIDNVPILLTLAGLANTAVWLTYAILHDNMFMLFQNIVGLVLCIVQLIIYGVISKCISPPTPSEA